MMMKNAVKCDNNCDMQPLVNHHIFERTEHAKPLLNTSLYLFRKIGHALAFLDLRTYNV
jgi:hypothetical protein